MTHILYFIQCHRNGIEALHNGGRDMQHDPAALQQFQQAAFWTSLWREKGGTLRAVDEDIDTRPSEMD